MEWSEAIDGLLNEVAQHENARPADRYAQVAEPSQPPPVSEISDQPTGDDVDPAVDIVPDNEPLADVSKPHALPSSGLPLTVSLDASPDQLDSPGRPADLSPGDLPVTAPPAVSPDHIDQGSLSAPVRPAKHLTPDQLDLPASASAEDSPVSQPPELPPPASHAPLAVATSPAKPEPSGEPKLRTTTEISVSPPPDLPTPTPATKAGEPIRHVDSPKLVAPSDLPVSTAPVLAQEGLEIPSRYSASHIEVPLPQHTETTLPPLQAQVVPPQVTHAPPIDEPGIFDVGFDVPKFAEMVSDIAAFKMAQREAELVAHLQDEIEIKFASHSRRFSL